MKLSKEKFVDLGNLLIENKEKNDKLDEIGVDVEGLLYAYELIIGDYINFVLSEEEQEILYWFIYECELENSNRLVIYDKDDTTIIFDSEVFTLEELYEVITETFSSNLKN